MLSALKGALFAALLFAPVTVLAQAEPLEPGNELCTKGVIDAALGNVGRCQDACNNASLPLMTDPPLCPTGFQCCYLDNGTTENAACFREGVNQGGEPGACVDVEDEATACASSPIGAQGQFCDNPEQICCVPATGGATDEQAPGTEPSQATPGKPVVLPDPLQGATVPTFIGNVVRVFISIAGAIALLMFVYGGIMWILSGGDQGKVKDAQKILVNATLGLIFIFGAYLFTSAILSSLLTPSV